MSGMQMTQMWQRVLEDVEVSVSPAQYASFLRPLRLGESQEVGPDRLIVDLNCHSSFHRTIIEQRYYGQLQEAFTRLAGKTVELRLRVNTAQQATTDAGPLFERPQQFSLSQMELVRHRLGLREDFTLDTFAVSSSNEMAHAAAVAVTEHFGKAYNPLFLYGGVGVGKTHLMQSVANAVVEEHADWPLIFCVGEEFTNEIIDAIRQKNTREFKQRYRKVKGLFIDDIQFIAGKTTVQEEFFHTFNAILKEGGQVVMTSDRPPQEIRMLEDRLRSRFEAGLVVDIGQPDFELRSAITLIKSRQRGLNLTHEAAQLIAANIEGARQIEGFLVRLMTEVQFKHKELNMELVRSLLGAAAPPTENAPPPLRPLEVVKGVSSYYRLTPAQVRGAGRRQTLVLPRHVAMYLLRTDFNLPYTEIGELFFGRDHTTVMHATNKITQDLTDSQALRLDISTIRKNLYGNYRFSQ